MRFCFRLSLLVLLFALVVTPSSYAYCITCDQSTGYICMMSSFKNGYSNCDTPSGAGCALWGACKQVSSFCDWTDPTCGYAALQYRHDMELAKVTTHSAPKSTAPMAVRASR